MLCAIVSRIFKIRCLENYFVSLLNFLSYFDLPYHPSFSRYTVRSFLQIIPRLFFTDFVLQTQLANFHWPRSRLTRAHRTPEEDEKTCTKVDNWRTICRAGFSGAIEAANREDNFTRCVGNAITKSY